MEALTDTCLGSPFFDDGIITFRNERGEKCVNVFEAALQAMIGALVMEPYAAGDFTGLVPRYFDISRLPKAEPDLHARKAISFLIESRREAGVGMNAWYYDYDVVFRGAFVEKAPWPSAFGQAYAVLAFIYWYRITGEKKYLDIAESGARFYNLSVEKGGVSLFFKLKGKERIFFEELPHKPTHILNAHLISLVALAELSKDIKDEWIIDLLDSGLETVREMLPLYDLGNWSRYDIPDKLESLFRINLEGAAELFFESIGFRSRFGEAARQLPDGDAFENSGFYISGLDWGCTETLEGQSLRRALNGNLLRTAPVPTGTLQNTYFIYEEENFGRLLLDGEALFFEAYLYSREDGRLSLENKDNSTDELRFLSLGGAPIRKGWNHISFPIDSKRVGNGLTLAYHLFHADLLQILSRLSHGLPGNPGERFASYIQDREFAETCGAIDLSTLPRKYPDVAFISINGFCGLACRMCDIGIKDQEASLSRHLKSESSSNMPLSSFTVILDKLRGKIPKLAFIGTEALLHSEAFEFLRLSKEYGFSIHLTTNGLVLGNFCREVVEAGIDDLWISIDGVADVHDFIRGKSGLFEKSVSAIKVIDEEKRRAGKTHPKVFINYTIVPPHNHRQMADFLVFVKENLPVECISFSHLNYVREDIAKAHNRDYPGLPVVASKYVDALDLEGVNYLEFHKAITEAKTAAKRHSIPVSFSPEVRNFNGLCDFYLAPSVPVGRKICLAPWTMLEIDPEGNCSVAGRCFNVPMGNLATQGLDEVWHGEKYMKMRELLRKNGALKPCLRCCGVL